jgi:hypothetical protein
MAVKLEKALGVCAAASCVARSSTPVRSSATTAAVDAPAAAMPRMNVRRVAPSSSTASGSEVGSMAATYSPA